MFLEVRKVITILEECCLWYILKDFLIGLREGLRSTAVEHPFIQTQWKI